MSLIFLLIFGTISANSFKMCMMTTQPTIMQSSVFTTTLSPKDALKLEILQLGASLDRGQAYNPTSGEYYSERMNVARNKIDELINAGPNTKKNIEDLDGEWELVLSTVAHGIFRSSPFFIAIQDSYTRVGTPEKAALFFKLHELQTCSFGISKVGRVAQFIDSKNNIFLSEFDTSLFSLTVIPILGWFKLFPTFGGCVITKSNIISFDENNKLVVEVDYTTARKVNGLQGLGEFIWKIKIPVGAVWKLLPWNNGNAALASLTCEYVDADFRIMSDSDGEKFVYTRSVAPRAFDRENLR